MSRHLERLLAIDSLIRSNKRFTNKDIAEELEVSERTIRNDLAFLRDRYQVNDFAESTSRIVAAAQETLYANLIFIGHNGPFGLGDQPEGDH